jgi:hypothetical protein
MLRNCVCDGSVKVLVTSDAMLLLPLVSVTVYVEFLLVRTGLGVAPTPTPRSFGRRVTVAVPW